MPTITIDLPETVSVTSFEAQVSAMARELGLRPMYAGHRKIKLVQPNPNAVDQKIRPRLVAVPMMRKEEMRRVPKLPGSLTDELAALPRVPVDGHEMYSAGAGEIDQAHVSAYFMLDNGNHVSGDEFGAELQHQLQEAGK